MEQTRQEAPALATYRAFKEGTHEWVEGHIYYLPTSKYDWYSIKLPNVAVPLAAWISSVSDNGSVTTTKVDPRSACMFSGLHDMTGRKIFQKDVVEKRIKVGNFTIGTYEVSTFHLVDIDPSIASFRLLRNGDNSKLVESTSYSYRVIGDAVTYPKILDKINYWG